MGGSKQLNNGGYHCYWLEKTSRRRRGSHWVCSKKCKPQYCNRFGYLFGNVMDSQFYNAFLSPCVCEKTYQLGMKNNFSGFCCWFWLPLHMIEYIAADFCAEGYLQLTRGFKSPDCDVLMPQCVGVCNTILIACIEYTHIYIQTPTVLQKVLSKCSQKQG